MKKFNFILSIHTPIIILLSFISAYVSLYFHFVLYIDFIIVSVIIAFPISFVMREAFRRREKALEYISLFKASLQSLFYCFESNGLDKNKKSEIRDILANTSHELIGYLSDKREDFRSVHEFANRAYLFIQENEKELKRSFSVKVLLFMFRINESLTFLIATKRHPTPWAIRMIILLGAYLFVVFYPASLLSKTGFQVTVWYVFIMTAFKGIIFICLYNIQNYLVDPFNQDGDDGVKLEDFEFSGLPYSVPASVQFENAIMDDRTEESSVVPQTIESVVKAEEEIK
jgi:hypothetical protein